MKKYMARLGAAWAVFAMVGCTSVPRVGGPEARERDKLITPTAAGPIRLGMTLAEVTEVLEPGYRLQDPPNLPIRAEASRPASGEAEIGSPALLIVHDQFAVCDATGRETLKFLLADPVKPEAPGNRIVMISVTSARFSTPEGVRPGSSIVEAAAIYGSPTLLDDDNEGFGREWVVFQNGPNGIRFEACRPDQAGRLAGIYSSPNGATSAYVSGSKIRAVVIGRR